jgi:DNA primase
VRLKRAGREWRGLSPFNQERTPSFFVNDHKGFFHDFSSGKHGDIFTFTMETEGVTFPEAVERLAALAGVPMPKMSPEAEAEDARRRSLHEIMALAAKFFQAALNGRAGARARGYLAGRGLDAAVEIRFGLGYAPAERFALKEHLGGQGVAIEDMIAAGLLIDSTDKLPYDRFRDRVMFPIADLSGRIVAFGGRALDKDVSAKYLNSPETPLFHKGATLYNGCDARKAAHRGAPVIAVEGYIDVIAMVAAGYEATVAPLGTALTAEQLALLWQMADEPILCFDGDGAGRRAAGRAAEVALPLIKPGKSLRFATLPEGQDPDDIVRSGGREAVGPVLDAAQPLSDMLWTREIETGGCHTPERRAGLEARLNDLAGVIADETVRRYYRLDFRQRLRDLTAPAPRRSPGSDPGSRFGRPGGGRGNGPAANATFRRGAGGMAAGGVAALGPSSPQLQASAIVRGSRHALPPREALILKIALDHPWLLETEAEQLADLEFENGAADALRRAVLDVTGSWPDRTPGAGELRVAVTARDCGAALQRIELAVTHLSDSTPEDVRQMWTHVLTLHRRNSTLNKELKEAARALGDEPSERNFARLRDVQAQFAALEGASGDVGSFPDRPPAGS